MSKWYVIEVTILFFSFYSHQYPSTPTQFINKMIQCNVISITNQVTGHVWGYFWTIFCSSPLFVYPTVLITLLLKSSSNLPTLLFFVKIVSLTLDPLHFHKNFRISLLHCPFAVEWMFVSAPSPPGQIYMLKPNT